MEKKEKEYKIIEDEKARQKYLTKNRVFAEKLKLTDKKHCIHCGEVITVGDFKIEVSPNRAGKIVEYIVCPNAPTCTGTLIDWMPIDNNEE